MLSTDIASHDAPDSPDTTRSVIAPRASGAWLVVILAAIGIFAVPGCGPGDGTPGATTGRSTETGPVLARFQTTQGEFVIQLHDDRTPVLAANFAFVASRGLHDGTPVNGANTVLRLIRHADGAEPVADWSNAPEFDPTLAFDGPGRVAYSKVTSEPGSRIHPLRFFITVKAQDRYTFDFPIFADVVEGMDVVLALDDENDDRIERVTLDGPWQALLDRHPAQVAEWRAALAR